MNESPSERPKDLAEFLALLAPMNGDPAPEQMIYLRQHVWRLAHDRLPANDALRIEMDSEDLAQDALLHLVQHVHEFRGSTWSEFFAFVRSMIQQSKVDRIRHQNRQKRLRDSTVAGREVTEIKTPSVIAVAKEEKERLRCLIDDLPESLRVVLKLRLDGKDYAEIAAVASVSLATARQRVSRALRMLRERWRLHMSDRAE